MYLDKHHANAFTKCQFRKIGAKDEVVVYGDKMERPKEVIPLKRSVKAQVHSLETRGRHHRVIPTNTNADTHTSSPDHQSNMVKTGHRQQNSTFTKNLSPLGVNHRSRSENPPKSRSAAGHRDPSSGHPMSLAPTLEDDFASRVNIPPQATDTGAAAKRNNNASNKNHHGGPPPPMPEKTKIHLRNNEITPTKSTNKNKSNKSNKTNKTNKDETSAKNKQQRQRRPDQPLPELPGGPNSNEPSSLPSSHPYEILPNESTTHQMTKAEISREQYKRSRSLGPVVEAAQRELLASAAAARERSERSRSRGPGGIEKSSKETETVSKSPGGGSKSKSKNHQRNNFNDDEFDNLSGGPGPHGHHSDPRKNRQAAFRPKEGSSLESSRGRSRIKTNVERSVSTTVANSKKPIKVDVMDPFLAGNKNTGGPASNAAAAGSILPPSRMPARQKSMIDLREPSWPDQLHHDHRGGGGGVVPPHHHHPQLQPRHHAHGPHQFQHQMMGHSGGRHGTPPRGLFPPDLQHSLPPQHAHPPGPHGHQGQSRQSGQQPQRPPMMRSATEHDIKIRNRRSMAVGPFEDLPPHIRQHMVLT